MSVKVKNNQEISKDVSIKEILKAIKWPRPSKAFLLAGWALFASIIIGIVLEIYSFGIQKFLGVIFKF